MALKVVTDLGSELMTAPEVRLPGWSEERYFAEAPEAGFFELKDGELIMHSPVSLEHQREVRFLNTLLWDYVRTQRLGEVLEGPAVLRLRQNLSREPDIFFVAHRRADQMDEQHVDAPVDLVIEVTSPDSEDRDLYEKRDEYEEAGIEEYWVVDLSTHRVVSHRLIDGEFEATTAAEGRLESGVVQGFWIQVEWLWQRPLPNETECLDKLLNRG